MVKTCKHLLKMQHLNIDPACSFSVLGVLLLFLPFSLPVKLAHQILSVGFHFFNFFFWGGGRYGWSLSLDA